ncbi:MAG: HAMP domain-containing sensor histidine kinase [Pseudomonadota bacterium]
MDETLAAEVDDFLARRSRYPQAQLPATITMRGYIHLPDQSQKGLPPELIHLAPGKYRMTIDNVSYRIAVLDRNDERLIMMYNATQQQDREQTFLQYIIYGTLIMTMVSTWIGWWLSGRIVSPITELARRVSIATPEVDEQNISSGFSDDEVGTLAVVFSGYLKRMRAFAERERAFTADVSHELRTPLAIVQGVIELMEEDENLDDKQQERIARIGRANHEMIEMTSALLLMAREENEDELVVQQCDVWEVVCNTYDTHRHLISSNTRVELKCINRIHVAAERTLLGIVIANLISNAFAYTGSGVITITLEHNSLTVSDTGSGISSEEIGKVFDRYYKGIYSSGAGIGLALVKRICERYGWETEIQSAVSMGTSAQLTFSSSVVTDNNSYRMQNRSAPLGKQQTEM